MVQGLIPSLVLCAGVLAALPAAAQFKCRQPDGSTAYQQTPCAGAQSDARMTASPAVSAAPGPGATDAEGRAAQLKLKKELADAEHRQKVRYAIETRQPMVGMTRQELDLAMGAPKNVNASQYGSSLKDQIIYERDGRTLYVYTENGIVTAIQNRQAIGGAEKKTCPTAAEIRDLEIEASKFANRGDEKKQSDIARKLDKARACR